jgi:hypothetical protein
MNFDPGTNVVDVCVRRLRRKLGGGVIDTVRNVGYAAAEAAPESLARPSARLAGAADGSRGY